MCEVRWQAFKNFVETHRAKVAKLGIAGHFRKKPSDGNIKKGTINVTAGKETGGNSSGGKETTKTASNKPSDLIESIAALYSTYIEFLRITGHINSDTHTHTHTHSLTHSHTHTHTHTYIYILGTHINFTTSMPTRWY